ncbi:MAG TPA: HAMP domain-containing sensor histidine kinase [Pseudonocardiaceae bacterium]|jgi:signal transduction histidine kinase|nr:HAMP domain-containing sensor histidine kinase [Pseudonocardiaceae bacterium]
MSRPHRADAAMLRRTTLRLGLQVTLTVAAIVLLLGGVAVVVVLDSQQHDANTLVTDTVQRADDVNDPPSDVWMTIQNPDGTHASTLGTPSWLPDEAAIHEVATDPDKSYVDTRTVHTHDHAYLVRTQRRGQLVVQAALDMHADAQERDRLLIALLVSGCLGLVLAALAGVWLGRRAVTPLSAALALQRRFVADAGHELRTPLTLLSTRAQLIRRDLAGNTDSDTLRSDVDGLVADARHLTAIMEDLLLAADPRGESPREPVDLAELATRAVAAVDPDGNRVWLDATQAQVQGSPTALRRALTALLDNATRHASRAVRVSVRPDGPNAVVEVRDDGPGIDPVVLPRIFDRFASAGDARPNASRRYGLGLALVSEIATQHGGGVQAENSEGGGALLRLTIPLG